jgi:amino acid transporter
MKEKGQISLFAAVLIGMNIMIGAGIFVLPRSMAMIAGAFSFLGWVLVAFLLFPVIWSVARASLVFPGQGGFYNYCKQGINETAGFFANWAYLVGYIGTTAALVLYIKAGLASHYELEALDKFPFVFNFFLLLAIALLNLLSIELISKIQGATTLLKLTPLFFVILIFGFYLGKPIEFNPADFSALPMTVPLGLFGFWGFESCCLIGHLIKGGSGQVFKAIYIAFFSVVVIYTIFHFGVISIMGVDNLIKFGAAEFPRFLGFSPVVAGAIEAFIAFAVLLSFFNALYGVSMANIVNLFNFAQQGVLPGSKHLVKTNRFGRPFYIVLIYALVVLALVTFIPNPDVWAKLTGLGIIIPFTLNQVAVFLYDFRSSSYGSLCLTILGFVSLAVAGVFTIKSLGSDNLTRLLYASPVLIGLFIGYVLFKMTKNSNEQQQ